MSIRDIIQLRRQNQAKKEDKRYRIRAKIIEVNGSIWVNQSQLIVWFMPVGEVGTPGRAYCRSVFPYNGMPVEIEFVEGVSTGVVTGLDPFMVGIDHGSSPWLAKHHPDHEWGGRDTVWLYPEAVPDLSLQPGTGLSITVLAGDYEYNGERKTFAGKENRSISSEQPTSGNHRLVGFYLDASNALQIVSGSIVAVGTTAPEPSWPTGAYELGVADLDGDQTTMARADIDNRKLPWSAFGASGGAAPAYGKIIWLKTDGTVAEYTDLATAAAAATTGALLIGPGSFPFSSGVTFQVPTKGVSPFSTNLSSSISSGDIITLASGASLSNVLVTHVQSTALSDPTVLVLNSFCYLVDVQLIGSITMTNNCNGVRVDNDVCTLVNCRIDVDGLALDVDSATNAAFGLYLSGSTGDLTIQPGASLAAVGVAAINGTITNGGTITGQIESGSQGHLWFPNDVGLSTGVWLIDKSTGYRIAKSDLATAISDAVAGDRIYVENDLSTSTTVDVGKALTVEFAPGVVITNTGGDHGILVTAAATLVNVEAVNTNTSTSGNISTGIKVEASATLIRCIGRQTSGEANRRGIWITGASDAILDHCEGYASGGGGGERGLANHSTGTVRVVGGYYDGADDDIVDTSGATTVLEGPTLANGALTISATWTGLYYDAARGICVTDGMIEIDQLGIDYPLEDKTNAMGLTTHFRDSFSGAPPGWTENDAAATSAQGDRSFWKITHTSGDLTSDYYGQANFDVETLASNEIVSIKFNHFRPRPATYSNDIVVSFWICADNSGSIDTNTYVRVLFKYNSSSNRWQVAYEYKDGSSTTTGTYADTQGTDFLDNREFFFRLFVRNDTNKTIRVYFSKASPVNDDQHTLLNTTIGSGVTWGQVWLRYTTNLSGAPGFTYRASLGAIDYNNQF